METLKHISNALALIGLPTLSAIATYCIHNGVHLIKQLQILQNAQKAQMRGQLLDKYYDIVTRGFVWEDELAEWMNQYKAYHQLQGDNEVLDSRKDALLQFPAKIRP